MKTSNIIKLTSAFILAALALGCASNKPQSATEKALGEEIGTFATLGPVALTYGGAGSAFVAQYLDTETYQITFARSESRSNVANIVRKVLSEKGRPTSSQVKSSSFDFAAMVGSGFGGLNPAAVKVALRDDKDGKTIVTVQGTAKEGLIKQGTSEKAVKLVSYEISEQLNLLSSGKTDEIN
ncbi:MAG: hypothetical protein Q8R51_04995 [Azonexus sp.]|nr:hypothetical protein [Azonexus sp.]